MKDCESHTRPVMNGHNKPIRVTAATNEELKRQVLIAIKAADNGVYGQRTSIYE